MRRDFETAIFIGLLASLVWIPVIRHLNGYFGNWIWSLVLIIPIAFMVDLYAGRLLSRWKPFFYFFSKFAIVGFFIAGIDFAVFNVLIYATGIEKGAEIALFKSISFSAAVLSGYPINKFWTFQASQSSVSWRVQEFLQYFTVASFGFAINVGLTWFIANHIHPPLGISQLSWDNIASVAAILVGMIWNFTGYKLIVFKSPNSTATALN